jgi:hypothetical protein
MLHLDVYMMFVQCLEDFWAILGVTLDKFPLMLLFEVSGCMSLLCVTCPAVRVFARIKDSVVSILIVLLDCLRRGEVRIAARVRAVEAPMEML